MALSEPVPCRVVALPASPRDQVAAPERSTAGLTFRRFWALSWTVLVCACGDTGAPTTQAPDPSTPSMGGQPAVEDNDGRTVVAQVNGKPVYDHCVAIQAAAHRIDARAAVHECIDFELLAQEAEKRGFRSHPAVRSAVKVESVRRLLDDDIIVPMPSIDAIDRSVLEDAYRRHRPHIYAPERRSVFHVFAAFPTVGQEPGSEGDTRAKALADDIHAALVGRSAVTEGMLLETANRLAGAPNADVPTIGPNNQDGTFRREVFWVWLNKPDLPYDFSNAVFEIAEPGQISRPTRSRYGWHVVLLLSSEAPRMENVDQAAEWLFGALRAERFASLTASLAKNMTIGVDEPALMRIQQADDAVYARDSSPPTPGSAP